MQGLLTSITRTEPFLNLLHGRARINLKEVMNFCSPVGGVNVSSPLGRGSGASLLSCTRADVSLPHMHSNLRLNIKQMEVSSHYLEQSHA